MLSERYFPSIGGGEYHIRYLVKELVKLGVRVELVCRSFPMPDGSTPPDKETLLEGKFIVHRVGRPAQFQVLRGRAMYTPLALRKVSKLKFDLVHGQSFQAAIPTYKVGKDSGKPSVQTIHGIYQDQWINITGNPAKARINAFIERKVYFRGFDSIISVDREFQAQAKAHGFEPLDLEYIPNGVDLSRFDGKERNTPVEGFQFLAVGRLVEQKGLEYLLKAASILAKQKSKFTIKIVGGGHQENYLKALVGDLEISEYVDFLGRVSDEELDRLYLDSSAYVLPSTWEGLPLTLLDAWGSGLPVVTTDVGGIMEVAKHDENAIVVSAKDPKTLAEAMDRVMDDSKLADTIAKAGNDLVRAEYSWATIAKRTLAVYERVLAGRE